MRKTGTQNIEYPFLPKGRAIQYVDVDNSFMREAKRFCLSNSLDKAAPNGSVIALDEKIIGRGANGSDYHKTNVCERVKQGIPTGQGYELCEGCHPKNHSEAKALNDATSRGAKTNGADLYLWGHWWCCEPCWLRMITAGIRNVYLLTNSHILFNRAHTNNLEATRD
jgi:deoxycytidylate deaminase